MSKSRIRRISTSLDERLRELASNNNLKYIDASREAARILTGFKGKKTIREIKF